MRKAKTLEQSHALAVLLVQTLKEQNKGKKYFCYIPEQKFNLNAPFNSEFLGAKPARSGEDY